MDKSLGFEDSELKFICYLGFEVWNFIYFYNIPPSKGGIQESPALKPVPAG